ncbi:Uncharacterised protein [Mycobacteroides abscessus subsp. abscessus]|nr:Uncharacterised protein [Mycobacteroides abscessus subsp. abscessus]
MTSSSYATTSPFANVTVCASVSNLTAPEPSSSVMLFSA